MSGDDSDVDIYEGIDDDSMVISNTSDGTALTTSVVINAIVTDVVCSNSQEKRSSSSTQQQQESLCDLVIIEKSIQTVTNENTGLKKKVQILEATCHKTAAENRILKANISSLYKTAKAEIDRKNGQIAELRAELDDLILRRARNLKRSDEQSQMKQ